MHDEKWRLDRLEREKWKKENEVNKMNKDKIREDLGAHISNDDDSDKEDSQFFHLASKALKKIGKPSTTGLNCSVGGMRGSFLSRGASELKKIAELTKVSSEARTGSGAKKTNSMVFSILSPEKLKDTTQDFNTNTDNLQNKENHKSKRPSMSSNTYQGPNSKKIKVDRTIDTNSSNTIFDLM